MKYALHFIILFTHVFPTIVLSQEINNVRFEQVDKEVHVFYELSGDDEYTVSLHYSADNGNHWSEPLEHVVGGVGPDQKPSNKKIIIWDVLKDTDELSGNIQIKVVAEVKSDLKVAIATSESSGTFTDERDGKIYKWVKVGKQVWMAENLNVGRRIYHKNPPSQNGIEKYCYDNNESMCDVYGGLYTWSEALQNSTYDDHGICPDGWHIPSKEEWSDLILHVDQALNNDYKKKQKQLKSEGGVSGVNAAEYLRSTTYWSHKQVNSDQYGLNIYPAGKMNHKPTKFQYINEATFFWTSSTKKDKDYAFIRVINDNSNVHSGMGYRKEAFSVRCIKD